MNEKRLAALREFLKEEPNDPFLKYGIAQEYHSGEDFGTAKVHYLGLLEAHPDYLPAYYQYALVLLQLGEESAAKLVLEKGITLATKSNVQRTLNELRELLEDLE